MAPTTCCHSCGSFNLIDDNGETACANCGTIVAEHRESNVPEFMENASGGHSLVGQIFNDSGTPQRRSSIMPSGHGRESREIVLEKGFYFIIIFSIMRRRLFSTLFFKLIKEEE